MRTIYDYKDLRRLEESSIARELENGVIITATSSLLGSMRDYYPQYTVVDIHKIVNVLIPEWDESTKDLRNYIALRNSMDDYISEQESDRKLFLSMQRSASDIWNAILLLVEADVYPQDIPEDATTPLLHFKNIWKQLEIENSTLMNLRAQFAYRLADGEHVRKSIEDYIAKITDKQITLEEKTIYFLGFYFITPIQARVIDVIQNSGITTAYLNCRDAAYDYIGEIWKKTYPQEYLSGSVIDIQPEIRQKNVFGDILNGHRTSFEVDIKRYASNLEFASAIKEPIRKGAEIYTPDLKNCEEILKEYYPELFERKHLLAFPVGQYIYYLHMMWNTIHGRLEMRFDHVFKCFASGWLEDDLVNGRDYLFELKQLEVSFRDCISFDDWRQRIDLLKQAKESINVFEIPDIENRRWHELLGNPFRKLSIYTVSDKALTEIGSLLNKLMSDAEYLFSVTGKTHIREHFGKISKIIKNHMDRDDVLEDELAIAQELVDDLERASAQDMECPLNAIKDAIILLIGGHFDEIDSLDQETALIGDTIRPLSKVESSMLTNYGQDIHLVLADEFTLPGRPRELPWPLSDGLLDTLDITDREDTVRYVSHMRSVIDNRPLSYRYLFFSFISNMNEYNHPKIHISWIKAQGKKEANASPYVLLLEPDANKLKDYLETVDLEKEIGQIAIEYDEPDVPAPDVAAPADVHMDHSLCKYRYLYSYLVNYLPTYSADFHYSFLLSSMIRAFHSVSGKDKSEIMEELFALFPFLRTVELRQAADYSGNRRSSEAALVYDDAEYPEIRLDIHYLNSQCKQLAKKASEGEPLDEDEKEMRCMYCPYGAVCIYKDNTDEDDEE